MRRGLAYTYRNALAAWLLGGYSACLHTTLSRLSNLIPSMQRNMDMQSLGSNKWCSILHTFWNSFPRGLTNPGVLINVFGTFVRHGVWSNRWLLHFHCVWHPRDRLRGFVSYAQRLRVHVTRQISAICTKMRLIVCILGRLGFWTEQIDLGQGLPKPLFRGRGSSFMLWEASKIRYICQRARKTR